MRKFIRTWQRIY